MSMQKFYFIFSIILLSFVQKDVWPKSKLVWRILASKSIRTYEIWSNLVERTRQILWKSAKAIDSIEKEWKKRETSNGRIEIKNDNQTK